MNSPDPIRVATNCRACGAANTITADAVADTEQVSCSHCRATLGRWGELVAEAERNNAPRQAETAVAVLATPNFSGRDLAKCA